MSKAAGPTGVRGNQPEMQPPCARSRRKAAWPPAAGVRRGRACFARARPQMSRARLPDAFQSMLARPHIRRLSPAAFPYALRIRFSTIKYIRTAKRPAAEKRQGTCNAARLRHAAVYIASSLRI